MLFDPHLYLRQIEQGERNQEVRLLEGSPGAKRAKRANPANAAEPAPLHHSASDVLERNLEMRPSEGPGGAIRAIRAIPPEPPGAISTFSTDPAPIADPAALLTLLRERGPVSYGAAASALGWGATRAWRAEALLRAAGRIAFDPQGRAALTARASE